MVASNGNLYVLRGCETDVIQQHITKIKNEICTNSSNLSDVPPLVTINYRNLTDIEDVYHLSEYLVSLCRKFHLLKNERSTILSHMDQLVAVQLALAEKNKQEYGDYDVETSTVISVNNEIIKHKLQGDGDEPEGYTNYQSFLQNCNYVDNCDILSDVRRGVDDNEELYKEIRSSTILMLGMPSNEVEMKMVKFLCDGKTVKEVVVETPLDNEGDFCVSFTETTLDDIISKETQESHFTQSPKASLSVTESYVQLVFVSYLELLVNSRSELALARSLNVPERELTHASFTDLKHEAQRKKMTMYQTAVSFVMRIRLGGKGYQPDPENPLAQHIKGLGEYVCLIQRLQNIIEEEENVRLACRKVLTAIKKEIIKCRDSRLRETSVDQVCERLKSQISNIVTKVECGSFKSPEKAARDGGTLLGRKTLRVIRHIVDKLVSGMNHYKTQSLDYLTDGFSSQKTPVRFACLLSQFRSPEEDPDTPEYNKSLAERMMEKRKSCETPVYSKRYKSSMDWAQPIHQVDINKDDYMTSNSSVFVMPSKTLVHPASSSKSIAVQAKKILESINDQENAILTNSAEIEIEKEANNSKIPQGKRAVVKGKGKKRLLDAEKESIPSKKKSKTESKTCRRKLLPQVKGQQQINRFFRV